jgi:hypothetical protein
MRKRFNYLLFLLIILQGLRTDIERSAREKEQRIQEELRRREQEWTSKLGNVMLDQTLPIMDRGRRRGMG